MTYPVDIDVIRSFIAITETGNFTLAGQRVGRTQPAISQQMRRLEAELNCSLFQRNAAAVTLTEHGNRLLPHAREILLAHDRALSLFDQREPGGSVVVGMPEIYAGTLLPRVLPRFQALHPAAEVSLVLRDSPTLVKMLQSGALDLSFLTEGEVPEAMAGPVVFEDEVVWISARGQSVEARDPLPVVTWRDGSNHRAVVIAALHEAGRGYRVAVSTQSMSGILAAVSAGLGVAAVTRTGVTEAVRIVGKAAALPPLPHIRVRLVSGPALSRPIVRRLEEHARAILGA